MLPVTAIRKVALLGDYLPRKWLWAFVAFARLESPAHQLGLVTASVRWMDSNKRKQFVP
jgi:hypothetical protein